MAAGALLAGCGGTDGETSSEPQPEPSDTAVMVDKSDSEEPDELAFRESDEDIGDESDDETANAPDAPDTPDASAGGLPPMGELDASLAAFADCLNENGADVAPFTLQDILLKAGGAPTLETRADMFGYFLDLDGADPLFVEAIDACNPILDAIPGLGAFLPAA